MATETTEDEPPMLSNYRENLEGKVKYGYLDKTSKIGIDLLLIPAKKLSAECLPPVESMDLLSTLCSILVFIPTHNLKLTEAFKLTTRWLAASFPMSLDV